MKIQKFTFGAFQENTYVVYDSLKNCVIIDPGCYENHEREALFQFIEENKLTPKALLNTHAHIDHVMGNAVVIEKYKVDFYLHSADLPTLHAVAGYAHLYGFPGYVPSPEPTHLLNDGDILNFGELQFNVIFGPGHAPGHVAFYAPEHQLVLNGDILFKGSFGRTDLPGGDIEILKQTIFERMFTLPENTIVYCGHGPETTILEEKKSNMILQY